MSWDGEWGKELKKEKRFSSLESYNSLNPPLCICCKNNSRLVLLDFRGIEKLKMLINTMRHRETADYWISGYQKSTVYSAAPYSVQSYLHCVAPLYKSFHCPEHVRPVRSSYFCSRNLHQVPALDENTPVLAGSQLLGLSKKKKKK